MGLQAPPVAVFETATCQGSSGLSLNRCTPAPGVVRGLLAIYEPANWIVNKLPTVTAGS